MKNNEDEINNLRIDNEIKKIKLSLEHGASFLSPSENKLSPEKEGQWLSYIERFENSYANCKRIKIYDLLQKPTFKTVNEIQETEIKTELAKIINLLGQKKVVIETICPADDRELYRFITEELFLVETDDITIDGMTHHFIYEEFHPNHEHDIEKDCTEFIDEILNKKAELNPDYMSICKEIYCGDDIIKQEEAVNRINIFREAFSSFELESFNITSLKITEDIADVHFDIKYIGIIEGGSESKSFKGIGSFMLKHEYSYWYINKINIPGIPL